METGREKRARFSVKRKGKEKREKEREKSSKKQKVLVGKCFVLKFNGGGATDTVCVYVCVCV